MPLLLRGLRRWHADDADNFVNTYSQFVNRPEPNPDAIRDINNYHLNRRLRWGIETITEEGPVEDTETAHIRDKHYKDDLVAVNPSKKTPMVRYFDRFVYMVLCKWGFHKAWKNFRKQRTEDLEQGRLIDEKEEEFSNFFVWAKDSTVDAIAAFIFGSLCLGMLVGPVWLLNNIEGANGKLGILTFFPFVFYLMMYYLTTAGMPGAIGLALLYTGVMIVFLMPGPLF